LQDKEWELAPLFQHQGIPRAKFDEYYQKILDYRNEKEAHERRIAIAKQDPSKDEDNKDQQFIVNRAPATVVVESVPMVLVRRPVVFHSVVVRRRSAYAEGIFDDDFY
jgi:hypothetical protein